MAMMGWRLPLNHSFRPPPAAGNKKIPLVRPSATTAGDGAAGESSSSSLPSAAIEAAFLRFQETNRRNPLFIDPYAGCFLHSTDLATPVGFARHYGLATRFIDDRVVDEMRANDALRQVVLLTDGTDTRPYRLQWPQSSLIFDVSPGKVFKEAVKRLEGIGAKIPKTCLLLHVPLETLDLPGVLCQKGFNGCRPSIWVLQGLPMTSIADFREILSVVGSLATKGCIFIGYLPYQLVETELNDKTTMQRWIDNIFLTNGFRVDFMDFDAIAEILQCHSPSGHYNNVLFVAHQLKLSDGQMENWRTEFQRIDDEGDEEGFMDMLV